MAFLEISGLSKSFKDHKVIRDLSIEIEKGEFLVVFGPSGCGKTVLLRLIAGMTPRTRATSPSTASRSSTPIRRTAT